eukprot:gene22502-biopygen20741
MQIRGNPWDSGVKNARAFQGDLRIPRKQPAWTLINCGVRAKRRGGGPGKGEPQPSSGTGLCLPSPPPALVPPSGAHKLDLVREDSRIQSSELAPNFVAGATKGMHHTRTFASFAPRFGPHAARAPGAAMIRMRSGSSLASQRMSRASLRPILSVRLAESGGCDRAMFSFMGSLSVPAQCRVGSHQCSSARCGRQTYCKVRPGGLLLPDSSGMEKATALHIHPSLAVAKTAPWVHCRWPSSLARLPLSLWYSTVPEKKPFRG